MLYSQDVNNLELKEVSTGKVVLLKNNINKNGAFIIFIDNSCAFVTSYNSRLSSISKDLTNKGYSVLFVDPHEKNNPGTDNIKAMNQFFSNKNWSGKYFSDENHALVKLLGATKLPEVFFVTMNGNKLTIIYQGALDDNPQNENAVKSTYITEAEKMKSGGKNVNPTKVPALGCRIKRF
jgi:hypothetical protein